MDENEKNSTLTDLQWQAQQISKEKVLSTNKKLALTGAMSALVIVLGITKLGLIPLGATASITILQIPVILVAMLAGLPYGVFVGAVFGILSLMQAALSPSGALDPLFVNPLCSVLPRMLLGLVAWAIWKFLKLGTALSRDAKISIAVIAGGAVWCFASFAPMGKELAAGVAIMVFGFVWLLLSFMDKLSDIVIAAVTGLVATLAHTLMVIGCLYIFAGGAVREAMGGAGYFAVIGALSFNAVLEAVASTLVCAVVFAGLFIASNKKSKLSTKA